jgi:serine/threonine-protein kinase
VTAGLDLFRRAEELFLRVIALPEAERASAVDEACRGDSALAREVHSMLEHARRMGGFLEEPALGADFGLPSQQAWTAEDLTGQLVGRFRLERCIGSGGMGTVYLASRADAEFSQRVAIKLVKRGMDSDEILRRFRAERQTLAGLHHPNIALLLDGGVTDSGQPYLVMEYVEGEPIDRYCDRHRLPIEERLALFLTICDAVRHAHQNLVIHRDLKPANILVSRDGIPKLVDFGIAKLIAPGERPHATMPQERRLTPEYASPEQVTGRPVTTSSDIYSLGVVLYELLCGRQPYHFPTRTPAEIERVVAEGTAPLPSQVVTRVERIERRDDAGEPLTPDGVGHARSVRPDALARRLRGDLDTIVLMALRKEPERRYASVDHLAGDIRRHLAGLPVSAHRDTFGYRFAKFARRHRVGTALGAAALLLLGAAVSTVVWQARVASRQRDAALAANEQSAATVQFLQQMLASVNPGERGPTVTVREVLDEAAVRVEHELASQPLVQASLRTTIGRTYLSLGLLDASEVQLRRALEQRRELLGPRTRDVAYSLCDLGDLLYARQSLDEAQGVIQQALDLFRDLSGARSTDTANALTRLGAVQWAKGELTEAEAAHHDALAIRREAGASSLEVAESLNALSGVFLAQDRLDEAEPCLTETLEIRRSQLGPEHPLVAETLDNLAVVTYRKGDLERAERLYRDALDLERKVLGDTHPDVAITQKNLAVLYLKRGDLAAAEEQLRACLATREACYPPTDHRVFLVQIELANALEQRGDWDAASALIEQALASARTSTAPSDKRLRALYGAAEIFDNRGDRARVAELLEEARREHEPEAAR